MTPPGTTPGLIVFSAPSGAGKTSLARALIARRPELAFSVSHTTRAPRPGEQNGVHYYFVTPSEFERMVEMGAFLEHAEVFGNHYGTSLSEVEELLASGKRVVFDIDWQGARSIKRARPDALTVFILPPSRKALEERLCGRRQDAPEVIARRMAEAVSELSHYREFERIIVNDDFDQALSDLDAILDGRPPRPISLDPEFLLKSSDLA